ncbi:MAG TPA: BrnA antitoxin family protein [Rhodothermales bacterium]|nr:BrnA antitoxin family protein [Rhodothermales bacterium]
MKKEHTMRHSLEELESKHRRGETRTDWERIDALTDRDIEQAVAADPDTELLNEEWFETAELLTPDQKQRITIRVDRNVLDYFKRKGPATSPE